MTTVLSYCVVPADTDPADVEALRQQYASDPSVAVVVDTRAGEDQQGADVLKQRRPVLRSELPESLIAGARLEQHLPPVDVALADQPLEWIIAHALKQEPPASTELRWRSYAMVLSMLADRLGSQQAAHRMVPQVMDALQDALPSYSPGSDFRRWLMGLIARLPLDA